MKSFLASVLGSLRNWVVLADLRVLQGNQPPGETALWLARVAPQCAPVRLEAANTSIQATSVNRGSEARGTKGRTL